MRCRSRWLAPLVLSFGISACGDSQADVDATPGTGLCGDASRGDTYAAGLSKTSDTGLFVVSFVDASPAPPDRGLNRWELEVKTSTGAPVSGAMVRLRPWMPDHGHGSNPPYLFPAATSEPGRYMIEDMNLFMAGFWQFTVRVERGTNSDELVFGFCVEG